MELIGDSIYPTTSYYPSTNDDPALNQNEIISLQNRSYSILRQDQKRKLTLTRHMKNFFDNHELYSWKKRCWNLASTKNQFRLESNSFHSNQQFIKNTSRQSTPQKKRSATKLYVNIIFYEKFLLLTFALLCTLFSIAQTMPASKLLAKFQIASVSAHSIVVKMIATDYANWLENNREPDLNKLSRDKVQTHKRKLEMQIIIFDLDRLREFRRSELTATVNLNSQLFSFDGLLSNTWFAIRINYRLVYYNTNEYNDGSDNSGLLDFPTKQVCIKKIFEPKKQENTMLFVLDFGLFGGGGCHHMSIPNNTNRKRKPKQRKEMQQFKLYLALLNLQYFADEKLLQAKELIVKTRAENTAPSTLANSYNNIIGEENVIQFESISTSNNQLNVSLTSVFATRSNLTTLIVPELRCLRGTLKPPAQRIPSSQVTVNFDLQKLVEVGAVLSSPELTSPPVSPHKIERHEKGHLSSTNNYRRHYYSTKYSSSNNNNNNIILPMAADSPEGSSSVNFRQLNALKCYQLCIFPFIRAKIMDHGEQTFRTKEFCDSVQAINRLIAQLRDQPRQQHLRSTYGNNRAIREDSNKLASFGPRNIVNIAMPIIFTVIIANFLIA